MAPSEDELWRLAVEMDLFAKLESMDVDSRAIELVPAGIARSNGVMPIRLDGDHLWLAISDPIRVDVLVELRRVTGRRIIPVLALASSIDAAIGKVYGA